MTGHDHTSVSEDHSHGSDESRGHGSDESHGHGSDESRGHGSDESHDHGSDESHGHGSDESHDHSSGGEDHSHGSDESHGHGGHDHAHDHHHAHDVESLAAAVVTVSTSRTLDDDPAGDTIAAAFESAGHEVGVREVVGDDFDALNSTVDRLAGRDDVDVVVTTGGTGVTPDDVTIEAVSGLFEKELPGFGELFRRRSEDEIGTRVVGTRATAGIVQGVPVFCLPGSENAARLGSEELIVPEAPHLTGLATRPDTA